MEGKEKRIISLILRAERRAKERNYTMIYLNGIPALQISKCYEIKFSKHAVSMWDSKNCDYAAFIPFYCITEIDLYNRKVRL